jgi:PTH2 family peptidyl-tRNA hydrolase
MLIKQVIVVRKDLNMRKGKMIAQGAHASLKVFLEMLSSSQNEGEWVLNLNGAEETWIHGLQTKIAVSVDSEQELLDVFNKAKAARIPCSLVQDAGATEFHGVPTYTAVAVGPDRAEKIDPITKDLKLL